MDTVDATNTDNFNCSTGDEMGFWNKELIEEEEKWLSALLLDVDVNKSLIMKQLYNSSISREVFNDAYYISFSVNPEEEKLIVPKRVAYEMQVYRENGYPVDVLLHIVGGYICELEIYDVALLYFDIHMNIRDRRTFDHITLVEWIYQVQSEINDIEDIEDIANEKLTRIEKKWINAILAQSRGLSRSCLVRSIDKATVKRVVHSGYYGLEFETTTLRTDHGLSVRTTTEMIVCLEQESFLRAVLTIANDAIRYLEIRSGNQSQIDLEVDLSKSAILYPREALEVKSIQLFDGGERARIEYRRVNQ